MASGAGKAAQPPGPGSAVNGTAAEFTNIEQELYDDQMHSKMCKKIAQLTKVRAAGGLCNRGEARRRTGLSADVSGLMGWFDGCSAVCLSHRSKMTHCDRVAIMADAQSATEISGKGRLDANIITLMMQPRL